MSIEAAICELLSTNAAVAALVGDRIKPDILPQGLAMPAITYQLISGPRDQTADGPTGLVNSRWQINMWAETYDDVLTVRTAVRKAMNGKDGVVASTRIQSTELLDEGDVPVTDPGKDVLTRYGKRFDFRIGFEEEVN